MSKTIVVDNAVVQRILTDANLKVQLPSLFQAAKPADAPVKKGCGSCQKRAAAVKLDFMSVKRAIVALPADQLGILKAALNADKLRVIYSNEAGETNMVI